MIALRILSIALLLAVGTPVGAQVWQPRPGESPLDQHRWQADQHRLEMDRLRARADQREAAARQQQMETRLNRLGIEAARRPEPVQSPAPLALRSPAEERAARLSAAERRRAAAEGAGQIDAWLDRPRD